MKNLSLFLMLVFSISSVSYGAVEKNNDVVSCWWTYKSLENLLAESSMDKINASHGTLGSFNVRAKSSASLIYKKYINGKLPDDWANKYANTIATTHRHLFSFTNAIKTTDDMFMLILQSFKPEMDACDRKFPI